MQGAKPQTQLQLLDPDKEEAGMMVRHSRPSVAKAEDGQHKRGSEHTCACRTVPSITRVVSRAPAPAPPQQLNLPGQLLLHSILRRVPRRAPPRRRSLSSPPLACTTLTARTRTRKTRPRRCHVTHAGRPRGAHAALAQEAGDALLMAASLRASL